MELIKSHNESKEGNEAIKQINIGLISQEIEEVEEQIAKCYDRDEPLSAEDLEDELEDLRDLLEEVENGYMEYAS